MFEIGQGVFGGGMLLEFCTEGCFFPCMERFAALRRWGLEAQMFNLAQMFNRIPMFKSSTKAPLLQNRC